MLSMRLLQTAFVSLSFLLFPASANFVAAQDAIQYNRDVRPILSNNCFQCHGFDNQTREAGLRLDQRESATAELESGDGHAVVAGNVEGSELMNRILSEDSSSRMPPAESGKELTEKQIDTLRQWIKQGAKYEEHWAFLPPTKRRPPKVRNEAWPNNLIDHFVLARLESENLTPSPSANKRTLIRRVALDVTGLPPTRAELQEFLADDSDKAYARMVDRYLASSAFGEHMTKHWLDLARYADTSGYQYDREREMWVWRDWVIHAYNSNMPFDQFTIEQLAGDLLPNASPHQILATGFNRNHPITIEGGVIDEEYRTEYVLDRLTTTSTVWMGLTVGCARCHDHKFDPISQKEFYELSAYFNQVAERGLNGFEPMQQIASPLKSQTDPLVKKRIKSIEQKISELEKAPTPQDVEKWSQLVADSPSAGWQVLEPSTMKSSGGSQLKKQTDFSIVAGGANPRKDIYEINCLTNQQGITAIRLECLTDPSLPGGGPGRHSNSNFVLSEFELVAASVDNPKQSQTVKFIKAVADYSQANYGIGKAIDGTVQGNNGWAVDGPTRKKPATAYFVAKSNFGYAGGTELRFRLRHEATFATHGIGRPRLSLTSDRPEQLSFHGLSPAVKRAAKKSVRSRSQAEKNLLIQALVTERQKQVKDLKRKLDQLSPVKKYPRTMVMKDLRAKRKTHVLTRGQYNLKAELVQANVPKVLGKMSGNFPSNRLGLAKWLVDPKHPLTSRVAVNRYWKMCFGVGLVKSMEDFGTQGDWPSHPELLDALAVEFVEQKWNVKSMFRLILNSATYRQSSRQTRELRQLDPENRLLARGPRFRLDAEQIRDQALAVSGLLVRKIGGPSVYPYQPQGLWLELNNRPGYSRSYAAGVGDDLFRRSLYTYWKRTVLSPMLKTFDAPEREFCTVARSRTNTPLQALLLLQGPQFVEAARKLAERMMTESGKTDAEKIRFGFELVTSRLPKAAETSILSRLYRDRLSVFRSSPQAAKKMLGVGKSEPHPELDPAEHAAWMEVARLLLNLDEVINRD